MENRLSDFGGWRGGSIRWHPISKAKAIAVTLIISRAQVTTKPAVCQLLSFSCPNQEGTDHFLSHCVCRGWLWGNVSVTSCSSGYAKGGWQSRAGLHVGYWKQCKEPAFVQMPNSGKNGCSQECLSATQSIQRCPCTTAKTSWILPALSF